MVQEQINTISAGILKCTASVAVKGVETKLTQLYSDQGPGKEIPPHLREEYRMNAIQIQEAKRQLEDEDLEGIFDASHNSSMESVNTAKLGQYLVVVGAHMGNSGNNKRRIAENGTEDPEISDNPSDDENDENDDENDGPLNWDYRGFESSLDFEESDSQEEDSQ
ncbi:hypothetical protein Ddc_19097 [Ditylenchus destructor]|nr:hypothetical protein Ddc_19097 [Ditylenchus destructor]